MACHTCLGVKALLMARVFFGRKSKGLYFCSNNLLGISMGCDS